MGMTRADKFEEIFEYRPATDQVLCNEHDCGESDACDYCMCNPDNIGRDEDWWNAEYKDPTTKNDLGVDTDKLIADCEKMSFDFELFGRPTKAILLDAVKNIVKELPSVTPQEPFINKPCVSSGVCEHDKQKVLDKIRAEIEKWHKEGTNWSDIRLMNIEDILDKYKAESKPQESEVEDERSDKSQDKTKA